MAHPCRLKSALVWTTPRGRDLVRLDEGGKDAVVAIGVASEAELRALAAACLEAADQMQAYATDAARSNKLLEKVGL